MPDPAEPKTAILGICGKGSTVKRLRKLADQHVTISVAELCDAMIVAGSCQVACKNARNIDGDSYVKCILRALIQRKKWHFSGLRPACYQMQRPQ